MKRFKNEIANIELLLISNFTQSKIRVQNNVPYVSQFASPDYAEKILADSVPKTSDPLWAETGANNPEEYARWVLVSCGMACTAMVMKYFCNTTIGTITLAKDALRSKVYRDCEGVLSSMHYNEYAIWLLKYGLRAQVYSRLTNKGLKKLLSDGKLVIVSANPNIRGIDTVKNTQKGGHLVLVTGYDSQADTVTFHNPSGFVSNNSQENHTLNWKKFTKYFAGRGIAVSKM